MESILIRKCASADIDAIVDMERQWEQEQIAFGDFNPIGREAWVADLERFPGYFLVAEWAGQVIGYINASLQEDQWMGAIGERLTFVAIENIYIRPAWRNKQVGGTLIEQLFEVAKRHGIERLTVSSSSKDMDSVLRFYRNHGFTLWQIHLFK